MDGTSAARSADDPPVARIALRGRRLDRSGGSRRSATAASDAACIVPAFVAGRENRLVSRVIGALVGGAEQRPFTEPNRPHGPITLVGPSGSGKTHLAHGLAGLWQATFDNATDNSTTNSAPAGRHTPPPRGASYLTASDFSRQLADAIDDGSVNEFRSQLRGGGLLVIDDLDRLSASTHVQEELLHAVDAITAAGNLVVFAAAVLPADAPSLSRPLVSRLAQGIVLEIAPLGVEARAALLHDVASSLGCRLDGEALETLATRLPGEPPRLLGAGLELRRRFGARINARDAQRFLDDADRGTSPPLREILAASARYYGVTQKMLTSASRRQTIVLARAVAIYLARTLTPLSYQEIGRMLGGRDHTTILHNFRRIEKALPKDRALRSAVEELRRNVERLKL